MNPLQSYYDTIDKMEKSGVDPEYIQGFQCAYFNNPKREEQRLNDAYNAGYDDGEEKNGDNFSSWVKN